MNTYIKLLGLLIVFSLSSCDTTPDSNLNQTEGSEQAKIAKDVSVEEFRELIKSEGIILDVRTPGECQAGMIEGAVNIDYMEGNFEEAVSKLDKNTPIYIYCAAGGRSAKAMSELSGLGFTNLYNLLGGYSAWK